MAHKWRSGAVSTLQSEGVLLVEDGNHGEYRPRPDEFVECGVAFIRAADMDNGRVLFDSASKINEVARKRITKGVGAPGDVLLSHKGTVGKVALVPLDAPAFVCSPQTTFWRVLDEAVLDRRYLHAFLRSPDFHRQLATRAGETDMAPYVSLTSQRALIVTFPPPSEQRAIARVIGALDDKIEINRRMNETLEAMARALFKSRFLDVVDIPKGWAWQSIAELADIVGGSTPSTQEPKFWEGGAHFWATPKDMSRLTTPAVLSTERKITDAGLDQISSGLLPVGTVLLSSRAPIGYLGIAEVPLAVNQGFIAMKPLDGVPSTFLLLWAQSALEEIKSRANGSTFLEISKANFRPIQLLKPDVSVLAAFDAVATPLYRRMVSNERESRTLAELRDALLPKLLSGEITIRDAEDLVP